MKTKLTIALLAMLLLLAAVPAMAQAKIEGKIIGADGQPVSGATLQLINTENNVKYNLKVEKGQYFSIGIQTSMHYTLKLMRGEEVLATWTDVPITLSGNTNDGRNVHNFDLRKESASAEQKMSAEEKARREAQLKESQKISGLNSMLAAANEAYKAGNYDETIRIMKQATETDPTKDLLWSKLGDAYLTAGKTAAKNGDRAKGTEMYQEAVVAYKKSIELKPTVGWVYNNMGDAQWRSGKTDDAVQSYQLAAQNDPAEAAKYYYNMGAALINAGRADQANAAFDKAIAANPNYADAYFQKAVNLMAKATVDPKTGTMTAPPEVATNLNKYLELSPEGPMAGPAKDLLASIGSKVETSYGKKGAPKKK